jgi:hypothetical protein
MLTSSVLFLEALDTNTHTHGSTATAFGYLQEVLRGIGASGEGGLSRSWGGGGARRVGKAGGGCEALEVGTQKALPARPGGGAVW